MRWIQKEDSEGTAVVATLYIDFFCVLLNLNLEGEQLSNPLFSYLYHSFGASATFCLNTCSYLCIFGTTRRK